MTSRSRRDALVRSPRPSRPAAPPDGRRPEQASTGWLAGFGGIHAALLPLRAFLGLTFLYAGFDKFATPGFLEATGPGSIGEQLAAFTRDSPLAPVIQILAVPFPVAIGTLIALAEIAIGLGLLTGFLYRTAAAAGALVACLFWLTASWSTSPYYYGADLPFMFGFITLAFAGHGGLLIIRHALGFGGAARPKVSSARPTEAGGLGRRELLQAAVLGAVAFALGASTSLFFGRGPGRSTRTNAASGADVATASGNGSAPAAFSASPAASAAPARGVIGNVSQLTADGAVAFVVPSTRDPGLVMRLASGRVVAYDATCTHQGCEVGYDPGSGLLLCPCHGAAFDPSNNGQVLAGPARRPLAPLPLVIDTATGNISLKA